MNTDKTLEEIMTQLGQAARQAARQLARVTTADKNRALLAIAEACGHPRRRLWPPMRLMWPMRTHAGSMRQ